MDKKGVPAEEKLRKAGLKIVVGDTIPRSRGYMDANRDTIEWVHTDFLTSNVIFEIQKEDGSVSKLFKDKREPLMDEFKPPQ